MLRGEIVDFLFIAIFLDTSSSFSAIGSRERKTYAMIIFPIEELMDEQRCYDFLLAILHPAGLHCPNGHLLPPDQSPHHRNRGPIYDYRCRICGKVYNIFSGTIWSGSRYSARLIILYVNVSLENLGE
jgi:hypothetical protein